MLMRERRPAPAAGLLPRPTALPSLPDALARRAAIFGPFDLDEAPAARRRPRAAFRSLLYLVMPRGMT